MLHRVIMDETGRLLSQAVSDLDVAALASWRCSRHFDYEVVVAHVVDEAVLDERAVEDQLIPSDLLAGVRDGDLRGLCLARQAIERASVHEKRGLGKPPELAFEQDAQLDRAEPIMRSAKRHVTFKRLPVALSLPPTPASRQATEELPEISREAL